MVVRKVSMILVGGVFGFHLKPDMQVHLALFLIALMIVAHLVARPFDELTKAHRVLQWLELGSLCVCWLTLHAGTVFFIGEKEGRISHESLTALSFYVVGGNLLFTLYLVAVYVRAACKEVKKENPKMFSHKQSAALASAAASYFRELIKSDSFKPKMSKTKSGGGFVNPMFSSGTTEGELQMADRQDTKTKDGGNSKIISARDSASEKGSKEGHPPLPEHWEAFKDEVSGNYYYYNHETDESQWEAPI